MGRKKRRTVRRHSPGNDEFGINPSMQRWLSMTRASSMLDLALRLKAIMEKTGGEGIATLMGGHTGSDGDPFTMGTERGLSWRLAVVVNMEAGLGVEVGLKTILARESGGDAREYGHDLVTMYRAVSPARRERLQAEYACLRAMAHSPAVGQQAALGTLDAVVNELMHRMIDYRYLTAKSRDGGGIIEACNWWSYWLGSEAIGNGAMSWMEDPPEVPGYPGTALATDPALTGDEREARTRSLRERMLRVLGRDIPSSGLSTGEDAVWRPDGARKTG